MCVIPAGLENKSVEIYSFENKLMALYDGKKILFEELPENIKEVFENEMLKNEKAMKLFASLNYNSDEMLKQYVFCNFGGFDFNADADEKGIIKKETWDCGKRENCPFHCILCGGVTAPNGNISKRELQILKLIAIGKLDKEIADECNIAENTVHNHKTNIFYKVNVQNRTELALWAYKKQLL